MVAWLYPLVRFGVGYGLPPGRSYRKNWKERVAWGLITLGLTSGWALGATQRGIVYSAPWLVRGAWAGTKIVATDAATLARAAAGTKTVTAAAAVGAGYAIGAVTGTIIVSEAEKRDIVYEGATADVLDFYMGEGHYWEQGADDPTPGYFNIPGNASLIAKHYWNKWI